ncbi:MAG: serine/threonine-protein kinase [Planctomycetota bacterium]|nr:MAG: serine/threonine-protein kinase [Planctomycetota bacterium]
MSERDRQNDPERDDETSAEGMPWTNRPSSPAQVPSSASEDESAAQTMFTVPWNVRANLLREGDTLPGYRIVRQIGSGGMGAVYLAEQQRPTRTVALKVIRPDRLTAATQRRFDYEAEILARLQHPGIAKVYEVGKFDLGEGPIPYIAMEYIAEAQSLTAYAKSRSLDTRERLELFALVCDAVHHGHQKGIIHRDLKPANILVDGSGLPRIIDFGVARADDSEQALATMHTNAGQIVGTLAYMAPEQCGGATDSIDVRADVYALGVVLFELLTDKLPHDLRTLGLAEALHVLTQERAPSLASIHRRFKGDLAVIVSKALSKDREERYQSASDLAQDVRRFLDNRPIMARPIGPVGLLRKWIKRNKQLSTAIAAATVVLAVTSTVLIGRIVLAERIARENLAAARSTVGVIANVFQFRSPDGTSLLSEGKVDIQELLDGTAENLRRSPPQHAGTEADLREILGVGYVSLRTMQAIGQAREELTRVLEIREKANPPQPEEIARAAHNLAVTYYWDGDYESARPLYLRAVELRRKLHPGDHEDTATSLTHLAATEQKLGRLEEAEKLFVEALEMRQRLFGEEHEDIAASLNNIGNLLVSQGRYAQAEQYLRRSRDLVLKLRGPDSIVTSHATHNLAMCLMRLGQFEQAEELFRKALAIRAARLQRGHVNIATSQLGLARALVELGKSEEAETFARQAVSSLDESQRADHPDVAWAHEVLGRVLMAEGKFKDAEPELARSIEGTRANETSATGDLPTRLLLHARCLTELDRLDEAEAAARECLTMVDRIENPAMWSQTMRLLIDVYERTGRAEQALQLADELARD